MGKRKNKSQERKKVNLVFDEAKRKDFLCGFRKRKLERKKKAQEELKNLLKEEKKRIKQENKESYKKLVVSCRPIPDLEQILQEEEYEDDDVNVKIVELTPDTLQKKDLVIGENRLREKPELKKPSAKKQDEISGMGSDEEEPQSESETEDKLKTKKEIKSLLKKQATKKIQKSKVYQMKNKLERIKNKKKSLQKKGQIKRADSRKDKTKKKLGRRKH